MRIKTAHLLTYVSLLMLLGVNNAEVYSQIPSNSGARSQRSSALKTAIFWESRTIDAHILLGRIFLELGDRAQALAYARSTTQIDPNNQEATTLLRQVERE